MTKKDYKQLVRIIRRNSTYISAVGINALPLQTFTEDVILWLTHDNPLFDDKKFRKAVRK